MHACGEVLREDQRAEIRASPVRRTGRQAVRPLHHDIVSPTAAIGLGNDESSSKFQKRQMQRITYLVTAGYLKKQEDGWIVSGRISD